MRQTEQADLVDSDHSIGDSIEEAYEAIEKFE